MMPDSTPSAQVQEKRGEARGSSFDVVVVGAGQAGLAIGHSLARQGRRFVILEAADSIVPPGESAGTR